MCGIAGLYHFNGQARDFEDRLSLAAACLSKRGPDNSGIFFHHHAGLAHTRLSIIDVSDSGSQPMTTEDGRFTIIFNGEIYNFKTLRKNLIEQGLNFQSESDTEVLLKAFTIYKYDTPKHLNGFFAFAIYDKIEEELFIARDRFGIKPFLFYRDENAFYFASELKSLLQFDIHRKLDNVSLAQYMQFNYIPEPESIIENVKKLQPGHTAVIKKDRTVVFQQYYNLEKQKLQLNPIPDYKQAQEKLLELLDESVKSRLVADVPIGSFLSGGIDSSAIVALASGHTAHLNTFSIGFKDNPYFDETEYANLVAQKFNTNHTVFSLSNDDLLQHFDEMLDYIDEPFADPSLLAVYILCKETRKKATVALSGDGADEIFSGYNKHLAEWRARQNSPLNTLLKKALPLLNLMPKSRQNKYLDKIRQAHRFSEGLQLTDAERYWRWCSYYAEQDVQKLLMKPGDETQFKKRKSEILRFLKNKQDFNEVLMTDIHLLLPGQMLHKVDLMSMANSLEVRVPFLDHHLVNYVQALPAEYKIDGKMKKKILQDAFRKILPAELYDRPKHGFDVPLLKWFRNELNEKIMQDLLADDFIREQGIFDIDAIRGIKKKLMSHNPGDVHAQVWALIVFQHFWKRYM